MSFLYSTEKSPLINNSQIRAELDDCCCYCALGLRRSMIGEKSSYRKFRPAFPVLGETYDIACYQQGQQPQASLHDRFFKSGKTVAVLFL